MIEHAELNSKIDKLSKFILSSKYNELELVDRVDLQEQLEVMNTYAEILLRRTARLCNNV